MKNLSLALILTIATASGEPIVMDLTPDPAVLDPNREYTPDYGKQIIEKFDALRKSDEKIKSQFEKFEAKVKEWSGGRYDGALASPLVLHHEMVVSFDDKGGIESHDQTVVIHYSFQGGVRRGLIATEGVFAVFSLSETITYKRDQAEKLELADRKVQATFEGFRKVLKADKDPD